MDKDSITIAEYIRELKKLGYGKELREARKVVRSWFRRTIKPTS